MARYWPNLRVQLYDDYNKAALEADFTDSFSGLTFTTRIHGGFSTCNISIDMSLVDAWSYLHTDNQRGVHYKHLLITEEKRTIWEGRILDVALRWGTGSLGIDFEAFGYWSSCRDQMYDSEDAGNTDWTSGSGHELHDIVKELLDKSCPDINSVSDTWPQIETFSRDLAGLNLETRAYPQDIIVDTLMPLSDTDDSVPVFYIYEDRIPVLTKRTISQVDIFVWLDDTDNGSLKQQGKHIRNRIIPSVGGTEGTAANNTDSQAIYPRRDMVLSLPTGTPANAQNDARDAALIERNLPRQDNGFDIVGAIYCTDAGPGTADGSLIECPKWRVRAGDVIRLQDLVPESVSTPAFDDLRTFFIIETSYDAIQDRLNIIPDRPPGNLSSILARANLLEKNK